MAKYHLSKSGTVGLCKATKAACPLGGDAPHGEFDTYEQAQAWAEKELASQYGDQQLSGLSKKPVSGEPAFKGSETIVPEAQYGITTMAVTPANIAKNDLIYKDGREFGTATEVKVGTKNVTVTVELDEGKTKKVTYAKDDADVLVDRKVETSESKAARNKAYIEGGYERVYKNFKPTRSEVLAKLTETAEKGYALSGFDVANLIEADAKDSVRMGFNHHVENLKTAVSEGKVTLPDDTGIYTHAYEGYKNRLTKEVVSGASRATSVSTSEASNLHSKALLEAKADFIEHLYPW